jgi:hypothetical protein
MKQIYFRSDVDLQRCTLHKVLVVEIFHRIFNFLQGERSDNHPYFSEILTAAVAHKSQFWFQGMNIPLRLHRYLSRLFRFRFYSDKRSSIHPGE